MKTCHCHTCGKDYHRLGIARHRAMHRDKKEDCEISYTFNETYIHHFAVRQKKTQKQTLQFILSQIDKYQTHG